MTTLSPFTRFALTVCTIDGDQECRDLLAGKAPPKSLSAEHIVGHWVMKHRFAKTTAVLAGVAVGVFALLVVACSAYIHPVQRPFLLLNSVFASAMVSAMVLAAVWAAYEQGLAVQKFYNPESEVVRRVAVVLDALGASLDRVYAALITFLAVWSIALGPVVLIYLIGAGKPSSE